MVAGPRRPLLSVVSQQQLLELRADHLDRRRSPTARSTPAPTAKARSPLPVDWGRYRLEVATDDPTGPVTSYEFDAGWYVAATSTETPDGLEVALDKDDYAPGEVAKLKVSPRFAGELLVTVGSETLLTTRDGHRAGRRRDGRHPGRRQLGRRRLRHRDALPSRRRQGNPHAGARHRREMAGRRSGRQEARRLARHRRQDGAAPAAVDPGLGDRPAARDRRLCHGRGGRSSASSTSPTTRRPIRKPGSSASASSASSCATSTAA